MYLWDVSSIRRIRVRREDFTEVGDVFVWKVRGSVDTDKSRDLAARIKNRYSSATHFAYGEPEMNHGNYFFPIITYRRLGAKEKRNIYKRI